MATVEIDIEVTRAFLENLNERLEAEEFDALMTGVWHEDERGFDREFWCPMDSMGARLMLRELDWLEDDELTALQQLKMQKDLDELRGRYPIVAETVDA